MQHVNKSKSKSTLRVPGWREPSCQAQHGQGIAAALKVRPKDLKKAITAAKVSDLPGAARPADMASCVAPCAVPEPGKFACGTHRLMAAIGLALGLPLTPPDQADPAAPKRWAIVDTEGKVLRYVWLPAGETPSKDTVRADRLRGMAKAELAPELV